MQARGILFLAYWFPPENESGAQRPARLSKYLARLGYEPGVVAAPCTAEPAPVFPIVRTTDDSAQAASGSWSARAIALLRRAVPYNDRIEWIPQALAAAESVLTRHSPGLVISTSPPVATHLVALLLRRRHEFTWIADFRDPIVGNPFRKRWHGRIYDRLVEGMIVRKANAVIVNTDAALREFARRYPRYRHRIHLIWNGFDPEDELVARALPARPARVLSHFGSIYGPRQPGMLVEALVRLVGAGKLAPDSLRLRLVGSLDRQAPWVGSPGFARLRDSGVLDVSEGFLPRVQAQREMAESDYLLLLDLTGNPSGVQVPAKLFEYVRIGRPILALTSRGSPVDRILQRAGIAYVCLYVDDEPAAVDAKLLDFLALPAEVRAPSAWFQEEFDARAQAQKLASHIDTLRMPEPSG